MDAVEAGLPLKEAHEHGPAHVLRQVLHAQDRDGVVSLQLADLYVRVCEEVVVVVVVLGVRRLALNVIQTDTFPGLTCAEAPLDGTMERARVPAADGAAAPAITDNADV